MNKNMVKVMQDPIVEEDILIVVDNNIMEIETLIDVDQISITKTIEINV